MSDDNVVFDHAAAVISKLQESDTPFEMMLYPGQTHRIAGPERQTHLWRTVERSEEHTSELQSLMRISYDVFCLKKKKTHNKNTNRPKTSKYNKSHTTKQTK